MLAWRKKYCSLLVLVLALYPGVARANLVAEYLLEEGAGTLAGDTSGNANNAYFSAAPNWVEGHGGSSKYSLNFDSDDYLVAEDSSSLDSITNGFSITAWIKVDQVSGDDMIVWKLGAFQVYRDGSNLKVSLDGVSTVTDYQIISGLVPTGTWVHVAVTYDGIWLAGYLNGDLIRKVRVNSVSIPIAISNYPLRIGWNNNEPYYRGRLDNIRLYSHKIENNDIVTDMSNDNWSSVSPRPIVISGAATTAIIIPDGSVPQVVTIAADELQYHIAQATAVTLNIYSESSAPSGYTGLIYIGACDATAAAGINGDYLEANQYVIRNYMSNLYLAGNDSFGDPLGTLQTNQTRVGTMLAIYRFLEDFVNVKWLWPGQSGEVIPSRADLVADGINIIDKPILAHTRLRDYNTSTYTQGWSDSQAREDFIANQSIWMRRQGFAQSIDLDYGHSFTSWWNSYGTSNPEYFNLLPDGTRRPDPYYYNGAPSLVGMCMAEPNLWYKIVDNWIGSSKQWINCWMNDTHTVDTDLRSMAWDFEPNNFQTDYGCPWAERLSYATAAYNGGSGGNPEWYKYLGPMSDRYARFLIEIQNEAANRGYLDAVVIGGAYANRALPPLQTKLNGRVVIGVVPEVSFPYTETDQQSFQEQWSGWTEFAGARAYIRPNYLLYGHNMPVFIAKRMGLDFLFALRRGMIATDYDSLTGQFSTQPLNFYMLARLQTHVDNSKHAWGADLNGDGSVNLSDLEQLCVVWLTEEYNCSPEQTCPDLNADSKVNLDDFAILASKFNSNCQDVEAVLEEFYSAFGPSESAVRAYFNHWEKVSNSTDIKGGYTDFYMTAPQIFTPERMATGRSLITDAQVAAAGNITAEKLVNYLEKGLRNAELTLDAQAAWDDYQITGIAGSWQTAIQNLDSYRASIEHEGICNMGWLYAMENNNWVRSFPSVNVSGGTAYALQGDNIASGIVDGNVLLSFVDKNEDNIVKILLDLGQTKMLDQVKFVNTDYATSNYMVRTVEIKVAPDELNPGFSVFDIPSYSLSIFNGDFSPVNNDAGSVRYANISNVTRRYLLIRITHNFWGPMSDPTYGDYAWGGDLDILLQ